MTSGIRDRATFEALRRRGRRHASGAIWIRHLADDGPPRVAYAIGRAQGSAVIRNRARRRLSAALDDLDRDGELPPGAYLVGLSRPIDEHTFVRLKRELVGCISAVRP